LSIVKSLPKNVVVSNKEMKRKKTYLWPKRRQCLLGLFLFRLIAVLSVVAARVVIRPPLSLSSGVVVPSRCSPFPPREELLAVAVGGGGVGGGGVGGGGVGGGGDGHRRGNRVVISELKPVNNENKVR
jgi:hypothetical protein